MGGKHLDLAALAKPVIGALPRLRSAVVFALIAGVLTGAISMLWPKSYKAEARILPTLSSRGSPLLDLASSSPLGELLASQMGGGENPILTYPEILLSRLVLERTLLSPSKGSAPGSGRTVLDALHVGGGAERQRLDNGIRRLRAIAGVRANPRSGLISVSAVTEDSVFSAHIVARLLGELDRFNLESRTSRGQAIRKFVEARLTDAKAELARSEQAVSEFRKANLRIGNSPQLELEQARLVREVEVRSDIYRLLARQYELAQIEEKRDTPTFSVIDPPMPPVRKHRPLVLLNTLVASIVAAGLRVGVSYISLRPGTVSTSPGHIAP